jgi:hypothetical protein
MRGPQASRFGSCVLKVRANLRIHRGKSKSCRVLPPSVQRLWVLTCSPPNYPRLVPPPHLPFSSRFASRFLLIFYGNLISYRSGNSASLFRLFLISLAGCHNTKRENFVFLRSFFSMLYLPECGNKSWIWSRHGPPFPSPSPSEFAAAPLFAPPPPWRSWPRPPFSQWLLPSRFNTRDALRNS